MQSHSTDPDRLSWDEDVARGLELTAVNDSSSWELGELASAVVVRYGEGDLQRFADAIGINYDTLRDYRYVVERLVGGSHKLAFGTLRAIARVDDATMRAEMLEQAQREHWTVSRARKAVQQEFSAPQTAPSPSTPTVGRKANIGMRPTTDRYAKTFRDIADAFVAIAEDEEREYVEPEVLARGLSEEARREATAAIDCAEAFVNKWKHILDLSVTGVFDEWQGA